MNIKIIENEYESVHTHNILTYAVYLFYVGILSRLNDVSL